MINKFDSFISSVAKALLNLPNAGLQTEKT